MNDVVPEIVPALSANDLLAVAFQLYQANHLDAAEAMYRQILAMPSPHAVASYCLGHLYYTRGRHAEAALAYHRAIAIRGEDADTVTNLGTALLALGQQEAAALHYRRAIQIKPDFTLAHLNLGKTLLDQGQFADAAVSCRRAIALDPDNGMAHLNLSAALLEMEQFTEAVEVTERVLRLQPDLIVAHANHAAALFRLGRREEALAASRRTDAMRPDSAMVLATLGGIFLEVGAFEEAIDACRRAIALDPGTAMGQFNLAHACKALNQVQEAQTACRAAVALMPDNAGYHFLLSHLLLVAGDFAEGWDEYEWRWQQPEFAWLRAFQQEVPQPVWQGEDLTGKTILLLPEQGLGDIILFARFAPIVAARAARVIIGTRPSMHRVLGSVPGVSVVPIADRPLPDFDVFCPLASLPRLLHARLPTAASAPPYLRADATARVAWRERLGAARPLVGLVWGGNPETKYDRFRSPGLARMMPLLDVPGVTFVILQVGPARQDIPWAEPPPNVIDLGGELDDMADTAAIIAELDLTISSCTGPLHLAAALGVPTWALLPFAPYFPWLLDVGDSVWYPSVRLYRRDCPDPDWTSVIARMKHDLTRFAAER